MPEYDIEFRKGLIALYSLAGDHVGFTRKVPVNRRRKERGKTWSEVSAGDAALVVEWAQGKRLRIAPDVEAYAAKLWRYESVNMARAMATKLPLGTSVPVIRGMTATLLETQEVMVVSSMDAWYSPPGQGDIRHRAVLLADDQGLGKTLTALAALRVEGHETSRAVVVCPSSLTRNWQAEMGEHFTEGTFTPWIATTRTPSPVPDGVDAVIIGWDILTDWAEQLISWAPEAVIADEGQYAKSGKQRTRKETELVKGPDGRPVLDDDGKVITVPVMEPKKGPGGRPVLDDDGAPVMTQKITKISGSARASAILDIGKSVSGRHGLLMPMSGTPIVNRPLELVALIEFCGIQKLFVSSSEFKERHCGPTWKTIGGGRKAKDYRGSSNLLELNTRLLTSGVYFRRTKQVLVDQGLLKRKYVDKAYFYDYEATPQPWMITLTPEQRAEYNAIRDQTKTFFTTRAEEIAAENRIGINTQRVQEKVAAEGAKHLKVITELRQATARLKVPRIIEQTQRLIERGEKVVIAAHHSDVVSAYADAFGGLRIQGGMGTKAIEEAKALFNGTPVTEYPVIVLSVEAGKTGHTLCKQTLEGVGPACAYMIFGEQIWTPADEAQAQDRIWRIGQDREVHISNALVVDSIDESIYAQRRKKRYVFNAVVDAIDQAAIDAEKAEKLGAGVLARQLVYGQ